MQSLKELVIKKNFAPRLDSRYCARCNKYFEPMIEKCLFCGNVLLGVRLDLYPDNRTYLLKFTSENVINSLRNGEIWLRPPVFYRNMYNQNHTMGDIKEFACRIENGKVIEYDNEEKEKTIFCCYMLITNEKGEYHISQDEAELLKSFGNKATLIIYEHLKTLLQAMSKGSLKEVNADSAIYYFKNLTGDANNYCKSEEYLYQHEYRIVCRDKKFLSLYEGDSLIEEKYIYHHSENLSDVFSKPIDIEVILKSTNADEWANEVEY